MSVKYTALLNIDDLVCNVTAKFTWGVDYASAMHNGVKLKSGTVIPPRPWVYEGLKRFDVPAVYAALFQQSHDADEALKQTAILLGAKFTEVISSPIWSYPRITKRKSKEVAGTMRNLVDLGGLRASQNLAFE